VKARIEIHLQVNRDSSGALEALQSHLRHYLPAARERIVIRASTGPNLLPTEKYSDLFLDPGRAAIGHFVIIRRGGVLGVCSAGEITNVTQAFQPSGRFWLANSQ
jgi:hypothetical protein